MTHLVSQQWQVESYFKVNHILSAASTNEQALPLQIDLSLALVSQTLSPNQKQIHRTNRSEVQCATANQGSIIMFKGADGSPVVLIHLS